MSYCKKFLTSVILKKKLAVSYPRMEVAMKRNIVLASIFLLVSFSFSACAPVTPGGQAPEFLNDIGKTLSELKNEHPEGEFVVRLDGFPDAAAACFGEQGAEYVSFFFGGQSGDFEKTMNECEDQLRCAGFITTADVLFTDMEDAMSFQDFFALIGVDDYEYFGEDTITAEGWLRFMYRGMEVMVNTNEVTPGGGWDFTGAERVKSNAPVSIVDAELLQANQNLADAVMFD